MTLDQYLTFTATLDWLPASALFTYLDDLGLWPADTHEGVKAEDLLSAMRAENADGMPLVARMQRPDGTWIFKQDAVLTRDDHAALIAFYEGMVAHGQRMAEQAREQAAQEGSAHYTLFWEPDAPL
jgi:hypothetical protein